MGDNHPGHSAARDPKVLILALGRINAADTANNGLLLRNLFGALPREALAQIYSSGDNGDQGFFGHYYRLGPKDRRLGTKFYKLKADVLNEMVSGAEGHDASAVAPGKSAVFKSVLKRLIVETGFYELIFRPRLSAKMLAWVREFKPDMIFSQGYNLTFAWLPVMLSKRFNLPIAYYPTDDWPNTEYRIGSQNLPVISYLMNRMVDRASRDLVAASSVRLAFNRYMQEEYLSRYNREFKVLMHGDDPQRFEAAAPIRLVLPDEVWIVTTGIFNSNRLPLLDDLDAACSILERQGFKVRATVFPVNELSKGETSRFSYIEFASCPDHNTMPAILKGADILFLPERFDETAPGIRMSVSTKAHLFMFSGTPTVVYSDPVTGIAKYAMEDSWAIVVGKRDIHELADAFKRLIVDDIYRKRIVANAAQIAAEQHNLASIQLLFKQMIQRCNNTMGDDNAFSARNSQV
jgi:glycosyltransferase involved in cell wall biosynthesis